MHEILNSVEETKTFTKRPIEEIESESKKLNTQTIATEVLTWVIANVENFIDNQSKIFKLDLVLDNADGMSETKKLQDLYRAIPDDDIDAGTPNAEKKESIEKILEKSTECRRMLDKITSDAFENIKVSDGLLKQLFKRMVFYYEKIIPSPENKKQAMSIDEDLKILIKQKEECTLEEDKKKVQDRIVEKIREGEKLIKFEELVGIATVTNFEYEAFSVGVKMMEGQNQEINNHEEKKILKQYVIPEGFTLWIEISFKPKIRQTTLF